MKRTSRLFFRKRQKASRRGAETRRRSWSLLIVFLRSERLEKEGIGIITTGRAGWEFDSKISKFNNPTTKKRARIRDDPPCPWCLSVSLLLVSSNRSPPPRTKKPQDPGKPSLAVISPLNICSNDPTGNRTDCPKSEYQRSCDDTLGAGGAQSDALGASAGVKVAADDPALNIVITAWDHLHDEDRRRILEVIRAASVRFGRGG